MVSMTREARTNLPLIRFEKKILLLSLVARLHEAHGLFEAGDQCGPVTVTV